MSLAVKAARMQAMGDPGLFGSIGRFLGGAVKTIGSVLPGPIGLAARFAGGLLAPGQPQRVAPAPTFRRLSPSGFGRGGAPTGGGFVGPPRPAPAEGLACPQGMHPNKSAYFLKSGEFIARGSRCVPSRRRNPANSRANDRAIGRIESAKKMAARLGRITIRKECPK